MVTRGSTLVSLDCPLSPGGMDSPFSACHDHAVDCGSVGSSTARWSHVASGLYRGVSSLVTLLWQPSCHGGWVASLWSLPTVQLLQNFPHCFVNFVLFVRLTCMCFLCAVCLCVFLVCTHAQGCLAMN